MPTGRETDDVHGQDQVEQHEYGSHGGETGKHLPMTGQRAAAARGRRGKPNTVRQKTQAACRRKAWYPVKKPSPASAGDQEKVDQRERLCRLREVTAGRKAAQAGRTCPGRSAASRDRRSGYISPTSLQPDTAANAFAVGLEQRFSEDEEGSQYADRRRRTFLKVTG